MLSRLLRLRVIVCAFGLIFLLQTGTPLKALADGSSHSEGQETDVESCAQPPGVGQARCVARRRTDATGVPAKPGAAKPPSATPALLGNNGAYDPSYLQSAYNLKTASSTVGAGTTVAIVDAYDDPSAESDLASYRSFFGLPPCTTAGGCFKKVNQNGVQGSYPAPDSGWAQEISLDLDMVSAVCPLCHIMLVEANSSSIGDLGSSVNTAAVPGVKAISNSYGASEFSSETSYDSYYNHPGIAVTVSSGDWGYGSYYPAASQYVTAVGGTTLNQATNTGTRNATETVWSSDGSGCSAYEAKPSWQHDSGCSKRTIADVAAVADPATGVWVYDGGWYVFGGTSVSSPLVSAIYALASGTVNAGSSAYSNTAALFDVTSGSNGSCGGTYLCTAEVGYDGPTGLGTPNGPSALAGTNKSIGFASAAQALTAGSPSGAMAVQLLSGGVLTPPASPVTVTLSSNSSTGRFDISSGGAFTATTLSVTVSTSNVSSPAFYQDTKAGSPLITATAAGYASGTQTETVGAQTPSTSITVSPSSATLAVGGTAVFTAADKYGNPLSVVWAVNPLSLGSFSPATGSSTIFTAGSTGGSASDVTATATVGSAFGNATVTVTASITKPGTPTGLTVVTDATRGVDLTWTPPLNTGGAPITSYRIYRSTSSGNESFFTTVSCTAIAPITCSYRDTNTRSGRHYYYKVAAVNSAGTGPTSTQADAIAK
jgi:subtilase family serine protease